MDALARRLRELDSDEISILEGHFSHHFADWSIVLRLAPSALRPQAGGARLLPREDWGKPGG